MAGCGAGPGADPVADLGAASPPYRLHGDGEQGLEDGALLAHRQAVPGGGHVLRADQRGERGHLGRLGELGLDLRHFRPPLVGRGQELIEQFHVRTRNEGFVNGSVRCMFPHFSPRAGYAATARIRTSSTPIAGRWYYDRIEWWSYLLTIPAPRFIVAEDVDHIPGLGALFGEIHADISKALGATALCDQWSGARFAGIEAAGFKPSREI